MRNFSTNSNMATTETELSHVVCVTWVLPVVSTDSFTKISIKCYYPGDLIMLLTQGHKYTILPACDRIPDSRYCSCPINVC